MPVAFRITDDDKIIGQLLVDADYNPYLSAYLSFSCDLDGSGFANSDLNYNYTPSDSGPPATSSITEYDSSAEYYGVSINREGKGIGFSKFGVSLYTHGSDEKAQQRLHAHDFGTLTHGGVVDDFTLDSDQSGVKHQAGGYLFASGVLEGGRCAGYSMLWDNHYGNAEKYWWWVPWYSGGRYVNGDGVTVSDKSPEMEGVLVVSESGEPLVIIEGDTGHYQIWGQYVDPYSGSIYLWVHDLLNNAFLSAGREVAVLRRGPGRRPALRGHCVPGHAVGLAACAEPAEHIQRVEQAGGGDTRSAGRLMTIARYRAMMMRRAGVPLDRQAEALKLFGFPPLCTCPERHVWTAAVRVWAEHVERSAKADTGLVRWRGTCPGRENPPAGATLPD